MLVHPRCCSRCCSSLGVERLETQAYIALGGPDLAYLEAIPLPRCANAAGLGPARILEPSVAEPRAREDPPPLVLAEVAGIHLGEHQRVGGGGLEPRPIQRPQGALKPQGERYRAIPSGLGRADRTAPGAGLHDPKRTTGILIVVAPPDRIPGQAQRLARAQAPVEQQEHQDVGASGPSACGASREVSTTRGLS